MEEYSFVKNFESLFEELSQKKKEKNKDYSTEKDLDKGINHLGKKIIEEAGEVWIAAEYQSDEELAEEMSQLLYWLQVMAHKRGLKLEDIYAYL